MIKSTDPKITFTMWDRINLCLTKSIKENRGLDYFVKNRSKFEGWLKVEICNILSKHNDIKSLQVEKSIKDKKQFIDIYFECAKYHYYIELKTLNTSYKINGIANKTKPITDNINGVIKDIEKLQNIKEKNIVRIVLFIVFPLDLSKLNKFESSHLSKIKTVNKIEVFEKTQVEFKNDNNGILYFIQL